MCKLEYFGNCDPETKDQEYCIFHKPNKSEEEAKEFWRKFLERFKPKKETIFIEELGKEIERLVFEDVVDCRGFVFPETLRGTNLFFSYAIFKGVTDFTNSKFEDAYFIMAEFYDVVRFTGAKFEFASFNRAIFKKNVDFGGVKFKDAYFVGTIFKDDVYFGKTIFARAAYFTGRPKKGNYRFYAKLAFQNVEFQKGIDIDLPSEWFRLPEAEAEACRVQRISYEKDGKKDDADRMFIRERRALRRAKVRQAKEKLKNSKGVKSKIKAISNLLKAYGSSFMEFLLADLTCEYGTNWERPVVLWFLAVIILFPFLYSVAGVENSKYELVSIYVRDVTVKTILILAFSIIFSLSLFVYANHDKHNRLSKMALIGVIIFTLMFLLYYIIVYYNLNNIVKSYLDCLYFSIVTATTLGYGDLHPIGVGRALASAEAIFGTFMWAVFLAVFARKYMR